MTFSVTARCPRTGQLGLAIASSSPAVAARCAWVRGGIGAVSSQNVTDPRLGPAVLDVLATGASSQVSLDAVLMQQPPELAAWRQVAVVDQYATTAVFSGRDTLGHHAQLQGAGFVLAGNLLAHADVLSPGAEAFVAHADETLGSRLLQALQAIADAGGETGPIHSAGLLIASADVAITWPVTDLRVDFSDEPVAQLRDLWSIWEPQADDYIARAFAPGLAPGFSVPGDPR